MKRLLHNLGFFVRVFFIVLVFAFASSFAELEPKAESAAQAVTALQETLSQSFDYCDVYYEEALNRLYVRVSVDGLADLVNTLLDAGYDETFKAWAEYKKNVVTMYDGLLEYVRANYNEDLTMTFHLVNDQDTSYHLITINGGTKRIYDIMELKSSTK